MRPFALAAVCLLLAACPKKCEPETDAALCARVGFDCDSLTTVDSCSATRVVDCGTCTAPSSCGANGHHNVCECTKKACSAVGAECGPIDDGCGGTVQCGPCVGTQVCGAPGPANRCSCPSQTDADWCLLIGAECGTQVGVDDCGAVRTARCGSCTLPDSCDGGGDPMRCGCTPESDDDFCASHGTPCAVATGTDLCSRSRSVVCGCAAGRSCSGAPLACSASRCSAEGWCDEGSGPGDLFAIAGLSVREVRVGGAAGLLGSFNGGWWTFGTQGTADLFALLPVTAADAWAAGASGALLRLNGTTWTPQTALPFTVRALWATAADSAWAFGDGGGIEHFNGTSWSAAQSPTPHDLKGASGPASDGWAVGASGALLHFTGSTWSAVTSPTSRDLSAVWVGDGFGWAVGGDASGPVAVRYAGAGAWSVFSLPAVRALTGVCGSSADEAWAVGGAGTVLRWNGTSWRSVTTDVASDLKSCWSPRAGEAWAVGTGGTAIRFR